MKYKFFGQVRWCGRIVSGKGVQMDPARMKALLDMFHPKSGDQLQQFVCTANWMSSAITQFTTILETLAILLESFYSRIGKRTKKAIAKVKIGEYYWTERHAAAFDATKKGVGTFCDTFTSG